MKAGFLLNQYTTKPIASSSTNSNDSVESSKKEIKFPNQEILTKELNEIFNSSVTTGYEAQKMIPELLKMFANQSKNSDGVKLGYELAYHDAFKRLEGSPAKKTNLLLFEYGNPSLKEKILNKLHEYASD